eukprot:TRINITY_DN11306_c0_g4_i4.p1 TRINITY_DN11306_c0_g4~~TRINITY_DN11306_c0_g4_i4.p1  ORF type:complete len:443 (-),score=107.38 TRINITY_DN11306_c0_g4_i4:55-1383(-)
MEFAYQGLKIPDPLEIGKGLPEETQRAQYTLAYDLRPSAEGGNGNGKEYKCHHKVVCNWVCTECRTSVSNFKHFLDSGECQVYFKILEWREMSLPEVACIYTSYTPKDSLELREYIMALLSLSLNPAKDLLSTQNLSDNFAEYLKNRDRLWIQQTNKIKQKVLKFDSMFESGNIDQVAFINANHYLLTVKADVNTWGTTKWLYFSVSNTTAGSSVKFEVINFTKGNKLYRAGMRMWVYSKTLAEKKRVYWHKGGEEIEYKVNQHQRRSITVKSEETCFYTLSFKYTFDHDNDEVYFAYSCPYTYSKMCKLIADTEARLEKASESRATLDSGNKCITLRGISYQRECYARTICGVPVYVVTVTSNAKRRVIPLEKRKCIVVTARVHAGETTGSFTFEGFWQFIFSNKELAKLVLGLYVIKVFPCLNPDGVIICLLYTSDAADE